MAAYCYCDPFCGLLLWLPGIAPFDDCLLAISGANCFLAKSSGFGAFILICGVLAYDIDSSLIASAMYI